MATPYFRGLRLIPSIQVLRARAVAVVACATIAIVVLATPAFADQTFPDPFGGYGIHSDIRAGSRGEDIGDAFLAAGSALDRAAPTNGPGCVWDGPGP